MVSMALWVSSWLSNTKQSDWDLHEAKTLHHSRKLCSTCRSKMIEQSYAAHSLIEICKTMITMRSASIRNMRSDWFAVCHAAGPCLQCIPHVLNSLVWDVHVIPSCSPSLCRFATLPRQKRSWNWLLAFNTRPQHPLTRLTWFKFKFLWIDNIILTSNLSSCTFLNLLDSALAAIDWL